MINPIKFLAGPFDIFLVLDTTQHIHEIVNWHNDTLY